MSEDGGPKFNRIGGGTRYDKSQYDQYRGFYQEVKFTWCNDAGVPVEGLEPTVYITQIALSYRPSEVPADRLTADGAENVTGSASAGRVNYTLGSGFSGSSVKTLVTPPYGFTVDSCTVYTDDGFITELASGKTKEGDKLAITVTADNSAASITDGEYYLLWVKGSEKIREKLNIAVIPASLSGSKVVEHLGNADVILAGVGASSEFTMTQETDVDITAGSNPRDPAESRTAVPKLNVITYNVPNAVTWYDLLQGSPSAQEVLVDLRYMLNDKAVKYVYFGTNIHASDEYVIFALDSYDKEENREEPEIDSYGHKYAVDVQAVASVSMDEYDILFTPLAVKPSVCLKWWDVYGVAHYARADIEIKPSSAGETEKTYKYSGLLDELRVRPFSEPVSDATYADGTILYTLNNSTGYNRGVLLQAELTRPSDAAVKLCCNDVSELDLNEGKATVEEWLDAAACKTPRKGSWKLEWLNAVGDVVKTEMLFWRTDTVNEQHWMKQKFSPAPSSRTSVIGIDTRNRSLFSYNAADGEWTFKIPKDADLTALKLDDLTDFGLDAIGIKPPSGAAYCRMDFWEMNLYGSDPKIVEDNIKGQPLTAVSDMEGGAARHRSGRYLDKTTLEGTDISLYTVRATLLGGSDMMFVQWYDANEDPITLESGRTIEYVMLTLLPYQTQVNTPTVDENNTAAMAAAARRGWPFATVEGMNGVYYLRCKDLVATGISAGSNQRYQLRDLKLVNVYGAPVTLPHGSKVTIYWPYPSGVTFVDDQQKMQQRYNIIVEHYEGTGTLTPKPVQLTYTPYGVSYTVTTFSPFLLKYSAATGVTPYFPHIPFVDPLSPGIPATGGASLLGYALLLVVAAALPVCVIAKRRRKN